MSMLNFSFKTFENKKLGFMTKAQPVDDGVLKDPLWRSKAKQKINNNKYE